MFDKLATAIYYNFCTCNMMDTNEPAFCRMTPIMHIHALQVLCSIPISQHLLCARPLLILADRNPVVHRSSLSLSLIRTLTHTHTKPAF